MSKNKQACTFLELLDWLSAASADADVSNESPPDHETMSDQPKTDPEKRDTPPDSEAADESKNAEAAKAQIEYKGSDKRTTAYCLIPNAFVIERDY